jgi:hypothetical protein
MITEQQLLEVFTAYNPQIWPMQIVAYILGAAAVALALGNLHPSRRAIPAVLAFFWLWVALFFWLPSGQQGYIPGYLFAALFLAQAVLFLFQTFKPQLAFGFAPSASGWAGLVFVLYALVGYPAAGALVGHVYPRMSPFGLTPCPVVAFTFGMLLLAQTKVPKALLVIPFFYALSGVLWISIGMWEDIGMLASGIVGAVLILRRDSRIQAQHAQAALAGSGASGWSLDLPEQK